MNAVEGANKPGAPKASVSPLAGALPPAQFGPVLQSPEVAPIHVSVAAEADPTSARNASAATT